MSTALPDYEAALARALAPVEPIADVQTVPLAEADGWVLARELIADRDQPPFNRAQMDGYALRADEVGRVEAWPVAATIPAGASADVTVPAGQCVAIATGAPLPDDVDTVIQHELSDRDDPVRFTIETIDAGHAVHPRGADTSAGAVVLGAGTVLGPHHLGLAAAIGNAKVTVVRRPAVCILTSGDEVRPASDDVLPHQIRNSNGPQLEALIRRMGAEPHPHRHVPDDAAATRSAVAAALEEADLVITIGGISAGERDHFPDAFTDQGAEFAVRGAAIQPGKPVIVASVPHAGRPRIILGLPGNPVSSLVCACLFGWPIVRRMLGLEAGLAWRTEVLRTSVKPNARRFAYRPARWQPGEGVTIPAWAGSGDLAHTAPTDGIVALPRQNEPVEAGTPLPFLPWPGSRA